MQIWSEFCAKSSIHGLAYLSDRKRCLIERYRHKFDKSINKFPNTFLHDTCLRFNFPESGGQLRLHCHLRWLVCGCWSWCSIKEVIELFYAVVKRTSQSAKSRFRLFQSALLQKWLQKNSITPKSIVRCWSSTVEIHAMLRQKSKKHTISLYLYMIYLTRIDRTTTFPRTYWFEWIPIPDLKQWK